MYTKKYGIRNLRMALGQKYNVCFEPFFPGWLQVITKAEYNKLLEVIKAK